MRVTKVFSDILHAGSQTIRESKRADFPVPPVFSELYSHIGTVPYDIADTDNHILALEDLYEAGEYVVFAHETQGVLSWAYRSSAGENTSPCYQLVPDEGGDVFEEDDDIEGVLIGLLGSNLLSSEAFEHYECFPFPEERIEHVLRHINVIGAFSAMTVATQGGVLIMIGDLGQGLQVSAGSQSGKELHEFVGFAMSFLDT